MYLELCSKKQLLEFYAEFGATEESVKEDVRHLIDWMSKQSHLPNITDEEWLANFLLRGKNSIERTKMLLENYYTAKALLPELFENRNMNTDTFSNLFSFCGMCPMPKLTPDGCRVMIFHLFEKRTSDMPQAEQLLKGLQMIFDICLKLDKVKAVTLVYNMDNMTLSYVTSMLSVLKKFVMVQTKISPIRYNKIYILNLSPMAQPLINFSSVIIKKQWEKVVIWKKRNEDLVDEIPKQCLPEEYGGTEPPIKKLWNSCAEFAKKNQNWFLDQEKYKADLSKKAITCNNNEGIDRMDGSFRKLCID